MTAKHRLGSWLVLVAMLASLPGAASGRFVCLLGMAEAGPACPVCHGDSSDDPSATQMDKRCCEYRAGERQSALLQSGVKVERPAATNGALMSPPWRAGLCAPQEVDRRHQAAADFLADVSPPPSFLSNFLRL